MRAIIAWVFFVHITLVATQWFSWPPSKKSKSAPILVQEIAYVPPAPPLVKKTKTLPKKSAEAPKPSLPPQAKAPKPSLPKPSLSPKKESKKQRLARAAKEARKKLDCPRSPSAATLDPLAKYREQLTLQVRKAVQLPKRGRVRVRLVLSSQGKLLELEVLEAKEETNRHYVAQLLPTLTFPALPHSGKESFVLVLDGSQ